MPEVEDAEVSGLEQYAPAVVRTGGRTWAVEMVGVVVRDEAGLRVPLEDDGRRGEALPVGGVSMENMAAGGGC